MGIVGMGVPEAITLELARLPGVTPLLGDSRTVLPTIVAGLGDRRAVYWLNGQ